jgi:hypothetical protein
MNAFQPVKEVKVVKTNGTIEHISHVVHQKLIKFRENRIICFSIVDGTKKLFSVNEVEDIQYNTFDDAKVLLARSF